MRVYLGCKNALQETSVSIKEEGQRRVDVALFGFVGEEIGYEKELRGETRFFEELTAYSKRIQGVALCGCVTDIRGQKRKSVAVANKGKLLGVSDMLNGFGGFSAGAEVRVYETDVGRMGVLVAEDLYFPEIIKTLVLCGSDFVVCVMERTEDIHEILLRAHAYCYGVPIVFCGVGRSMIADETGRLIFDFSREAFAEFFLKKSITLSSVEERG